MIFINTDLNFEITLLILKEKKKLILTDKVLPMNLALLTRAAHGGFPLVAEELCLSFVLENVVSIFKCSRFLHWNFRLLFQRGWSGFCDCSYMACAFKQFARVCDGSWCRWREIAIFGAATCAKTVDAYRVRFGVPPTRTFFIQVELFLTNRTGRLLRWVRWEGLREDERQFLLIVVAFWRIKAKTTDTSWAGIAFRAISLLSTRAITSLTAVDRISIAPNISLRMSSQRYHWVKCLGSCDLCSLLSDHKNNQRKRHKCQLFYVLGPQMTWRIHLASDAFA